MYKGPVSISAKLQSLNDHAAMEPKSPAQPEGRPATHGDEAAPAEGAPTSEQTGSEPAAPAAAARELPKIAERADDLEAIKKAVDDAAAVGGGLWLSYLFVLFYLAVAAGAVTHADLFFENPVKLPFLNIELPLLAFFFLAPILFLVVHAYTLVHLVMLTDKAKRFDQALRDQIGDENAAVRDSLRRQLPSNIFIQFLAGPRDVRESAFGWLLRAIAMGDAGHRAGPSAVADADPVLAVSQQLHHLDPSHRALHRSGARVVAMAKDPFRARGRPPALWFLGLAYSRSRALSRDRSLLLDGGDVSRRVAGRQLAGLATLRATDEAGGGSRCRSMIGSSTPKSIQYAPPPAPLFQHASSARS